MPALRPQVAEFPDSTRHEGKVGCNLPAYPPRWAITPAAPSECDCSTKERRTGGTEAVGMLDREMMCLFGELSRLKESIQADLRPAGRLGHLNTHGESVFQLLDVGDHQDAGEIILNGVNGLHQALAALGILGAKPLVYD